jgi:DNA-binding PadR family transcriptional regulator
MARKPTGGPASDPELLILSTLIQGPKHGYAMIEDIAAETGVELGPGTLYGAITRLVENGWVAPTESAGRQRPYRLTAGGAEYLKAQLESIQQLARLGLRRLRVVWG